MSTAKPTPDYQAGSGRVDIAATTKNTVVATGSAYLGIHSPTKEPGAKPERTLTYTNAGDAPVTLTLRSTTRTSRRHVVNVRRATAGQRRVRSSGTSSSGS